MPTQVNVENEATARRLCDAETGEFIRSATTEEAKKFDVLAVVIVNAAITVNGRRCHVEA
jgi:hypothetical protein